jgi:putative oxidoreductase
MNIVLWIVQILLALLFLFAGTTKFLMPYSELIKDAPVVFPHWFFLFIGACEILGGLGLVLPWALKIKPGLTPLAAWLLLIIMIGAVVISAMGGIALAIPGLVAGILLAFVGYGRSRKPAMP